MTSERPAPALPPTLCSLSDFMLGILDQGGEMSENVFKGSGTVVSVE